MDDYNAVKITDYCPRAAPFDSYLKGRELVGVEVGVDVGAHAEALLTYGPVAMLHLIDPWPKDYFRGYCDGRLSRFRGRYRLWPGTSMECVKGFFADTLDFVYIDQEHDAESVAADLRAWWPLLKSGGVLGLRNYTARDTPLDRAVDAFVGGSRAAEITRHVESAEIVLVKA